MKKVLPILFFALSAVSLSAQADSTKKSVEKAIVNDVKSDTRLIDLANATLKAHGGDALRNMKTLTLIGSADITASVMPQKLPGNFVTVFSGEKYRLELTIPGQPVKQIFDGNQTFTNAPGGVELPPLNRFGLAMIQRIGEAGYVISGLADDKEFKKGFRVTSPEGFYTDFVIDKKTGYVKSYNSSFVIRGSNVSTSVEIDKMRIVEEIVIPEKYAQRFDLGQIIVYAEFKAKDILVNKEVKDDVFVMN